MNQYEAEKLMAEASEPILDRVFEDRTAEETKNLGLKIIHSGRFLVIFGVKGETSASSSCGQVEGNLHRFKRMASLAQRSL